MNVPISTGTLREIEAAMDVTAARFECPMAALRHIARHWPNHPAAMVARSVIAAAAVSARKMEPAA